MPLLHMHLVTHLFPIMLEEKPENKDSSATLTIVCVMLKTKPNMQQWLRKELRTENMNDLILTPQGCLGYTKSCVLELQVGLCD